MTVLAVCNETTDNLGYIGERVHALGLGPVTTVYREDFRSWPEPTGFDLVISTGSLWSVTEERHAAAVRHEADLYRRALAGAVPVFAICYGAHVLAIAHGAPALPAPKPEAGFIVADTADPGRVPTGPWLTWHSDLLTVPAGATLLARTPLAPQAWTLERAMAVQFHAELTPRELAAWIPRGADWLHDHHVDTDALLADAHDREEGLRARAHTLFDAFWSRVVQDPDR